MPGPDLSRAPTRRRRTAVLAAALTAAATLAGCSGGSSGSTAPANPSDTLNILAGSELSDMVPILTAARAATGVQVNLTYSGSLSGADQIATSTAGLDAAWFSSDKYVALAGASTKILDRHSIMLSPVIVGVKQSSATRLGWTGQNVGWAQIATAAASGQFTYAMTNPTASNSGFSALVGVADALTGNQALSATNIDVPGLQGFFSGQSVSAGSSGFLSQAYESGQDKLDGIVNYESVLVGLNKSGQLHEPLTLVYPTAGIVTADYPVMLLDAAKRTAYNKLVAYLTSPAVQAQIQTQTFRRAAVPGVPPSPDLYAGLLVEASFPANLAVTQQLLDDFQSQIRRPAHTIYVLDTSGSMDGDRLQRLQKALTGLAGLDTSFSGHFTQFQPREQVTMIDFSDSVKNQQTFTIDSTDPNSASLVAVRDYVDNLSAGGGTAIYSALSAAVTDADQIQASQPDAYVSIVLMTDGENNEGISANQLLSQISKDPVQTRIYTVLFGEGSPQQLTQIANATNAKVFDARNADLSTVFKEIRGYQ